jgi:hypothetical protein
LAEQQHVLHGRSLLEAVGGVDVMTSHADADLGQEIFEIFEIFEIAVSVAACR